MLEYMFVLLFGYIARMLPLSLALSVGSALGDFVFYGVRVRRKIVLKNLRTAFDAEKSEEEIRRIARATYRNLGRILVEVSRFPVLRRQNGLTEQVRIAHPEVMERMKRKGKGVVLVSGHFGNWEMLGATVARWGEFNVLALTQKNRRVDRLLNDYRGSMGVRPIPLGASVKVILQTLNRGEWVGFLSDQDAGQEGMFVDFFGVPSSTPPGPAAVALKRKIPLVMALIVREKGGRHRAVFEQIWDGEEQGQTVWSLTQAYTKRLESYIRKHPDHWFWLHRRWKSTDFLKDKRL